MSPFNFITHSPKLLTSELIISHIHSTHLSAHSITQTTSQLNWLYNSFTPLIQFTVTHSRNTPLNSRSCLFTQITYQLSLSLNSSLNSLYNPFMQLTHLSTHYLSSTQHTHLSTNSITHSFTTITSELTIYHSCTQIPLQFTLSFNHSTDVSTTTQLTSQLTPSFIPAFDSPLSSLLLTRLTHPLTSYSPTQLTLNCIPQLSTQLAHLAHSLA